MNDIVKKELPTDLTSYDFLKFTAVLLMIIDHVGMYFYPEEEWFRVVGRFCVPMWFFLIGYARSRDLGPKMWVGGSILVLANIPAGLSILPFNILYTMIFVRLVLDKVMAHAIKGKHEFWAMCAILFFLIFPTAIVTEYGAQGIIMAMFGHMVRHRVDSKEGRDHLTNFTVFALMQFVVVNSVLGGFNQLQFIVLGAGSFLVMLGLMYFKPATYPGITSKLPRPVVSVLKLGGRRTLEIYVVHLLLFKILAVCLGYHELFDWSLRPPETLAE
jgi:surface polysaccharide O-acyltransferase-like enzyme